MGTWRIFCGKAMIKQGTQVYLVDGLDLSVGTQTLGFVSHICNYNNVEREHLKRVRSQERIFNTEEGKLRKDQQKAKTPEDKIRVEINIAHNEGSHVEALGQLSKQFEDLLSKELIVISFPTVLVTASQDEVIVVEEKETEVPEEKEIDYSGFE